MIHVSWVRNILNTLHEGLHCFSQLWLTTPCAPPRHAGVATEVVTYKPSSAQNWENGSATASPKQNCSFVLEKKNSLLEIAGLDYTINTQHYLEQQSFSDTGACYLKLL